VTNNIAGGIVYAGFLAPAHKCGEEATQTVFRDNVAHSSTSTSSGEGLVTFPNKADSSHSTCYQASHFSGYKLRVAGVNSFQITKKTVLSDMTLVDNHFSFAVNIVCPGDYEPNEIVIKNSHMYGDSISPDCPDNGGFCEQIDKYGMVIGGSIRGGKLPHNPTTSPRPHYKIKTDACWTGGYSLEGNTFIGFDGKTQ
jgi:hypothetical protein